MLCVIQKPAPSAHAISPHTPICAKLAKLGEPVVKHKVSAWLHIAAPRGEHCKCALRPALRHTHGSV